MDNTSEKLNCWEYMQCGREPGGRQVEEFGVCPAATTQTRDGIHEGTNAGRYCWAVSGTLCGGEVQGLYARKMLNCATRCPFYRLVREQEGPAFKLFI